MGELSVVLILMAAGGVLGCSTARAEEIHGPLAGVAWSPPRDWTAHDTDGSVHCLGNGRLCVYGQGPDIIQIFGPPYSTTSIGRAGLDQPGLTCQSRRVLGTAIWQHRIESEGRVVAVVTDFVDSERPCFVRHVQAAAPVAFVFHLETDVRTAANDAMVPGAKGGFLGETPIGKPSVPFGNYPIPFAFFHQFAWRGEVEAAVESSAVVRFRFGPGQSTLYVTGGPELAACMEHMKAILSEEYASLLARTKSWWEKPKTWCTAQNNSSKNWG